MYFCMFLKEPPNLVLADVNLEKYKGNLENVSLNIFSKLINSENNSSSKTY